MPKVVHDLVDKLLADPDFYPKKSEKEQEAIAWAIAYSKQNKKKGKSRKNKADADAINTIVSYGKKLEANSNFHEADALIRIAVNLIDDNSNNPE
jgi:hypothetical protein